MKLGTLTAALADLPLEEACGFLADNGVQMVEIGCGGFPGKAHCDAAELLADAGKRKAFMDVIHGHGLEISALSSHGNMVHPDKAAAKAYDDDLTNAILLAEELGVPVFLYEDSASSPDRANLADVRRGQFEGMAEKLLKPEWAPDFGERKIHPTAGVVAVGARMPLIAYNVNLDTSDLEIASRIAKAIRCSSGGFKYCKAIGVMLEGRNIAQVSMNLVNYEGTPIYYVFEMIRALADRYGVRIIGSELVGLTPGKALLDCAEYYLKLEDFDCRRQVMEYHLIGLE